MPGPLRIAHVGAKDQVCVTGFGHFSQRLGFRTRDLNRHLQLVFSLAGK